MFLKRVAVVWDVSPGGSDVVCSNETVADLFGKMTNDRIQLEFLEATSDSRRKILAKGHAWMLRKGINGSLCYRCLEKRWL